MGCCHFADAGRENVEALFMFCLAVEKYIKANWVNDNIENIPPRIHDLQSIYSQTDLDLEPDLIDFWTLSTGGILKAGILTSSLVYID